MSAEGRWNELGDGVFARRYAELDLTVGLVVGEDACLVIDTRGNEAQGAEFAAAVREITDAPWTVVLTHAHFDHVLGTSAFLPATVWAHERAAKVLVPGADLGRGEFVREYEAQGRSEDAARLSAARVVGPDRTVAEHVTLDLGRTVHFDHFGPAHTDNDLVVSVPDARVMFAGDLVEHDETTGSFSAESFGPETHLANWSRALSSVLSIDPTIVVCGHGAPVDRDFVVSAHDRLHALFTLRTSVRNGELTAAEAISSASLPEDVVRAALTTTD
ncbi:MAG TPA: MBL fold metallo-hydrolase [Pseudonocardiaceae bacterium]|nr:MBL fold metallo-hydrolase [Pseudonocardiaceae bacterium]